MTAGGKTISELASECGIDHRHYAELTHTPGTGLPVVNLRCERQRGVLTTITGAISGQLEVKSRATTGRPILPERDPLEAVLALHIRDGDFCAEDGFVWPCRTVRAADPSEATRGRLVGRLEGLAAQWRTRVVDNEARLGTSPGDEIADQETVGFIDATRVCLVELEAAMSE